MNLVTYTGECVFVIDLLHIYQIFTHFSQWHTHMLRPMQSFAIKQRTGNNIIKL